VITTPPMVTGGQFPRPYYIVTSTSFHFELDEIGGSVTDNYDQVDLEFPTPAEQISTADVPSPQRAIETIIHNDTDGASSLMQAAFRGHTEIVRFLLSKGARVNEKDRDAWTPLMFAGSAGRSETVQALLQGGAKVDAEAENGATALLISAGEVHTKTAGGI